MFFLQKVSKTPTFCSLKVEGNFKLSNIDVLMVWNKCNFKVTAILFVKLKIRRLTTSWAKLVISS